MNKDWRGILKINTLSQIRNGKVIYSENNILNVLHQLGESFLLSVCFSNDGSLLPSNYYFGLDNRSTVNINDTISSLYEEPTSGGYIRQPVSSNTGFTISSVSGIFRATSPTLVFTATGAGFGPVKNLFMTTSNDNTGYLISSAPLSNNVTLASGDTLNLTMSLQLHDCP
jgi:hypothetical protein